MAVRRVFVSYSWDNANHKKWVANLATHLRRDGVNIILDQWDAIPGDQLTEFMEREIINSDFVLIICTPNYKEKSDGRKGGVGYEGTMITAEIFCKGNKRKFIPILSYGSWSSAAPLWIEGAFHIDLSSRRMFEQNYKELLMTINGTRPKAPPIGRECQYGPSIEKNHILISTESPFNNEIRKKLLALREFLKIDVDTFNDKKQLTFTDYLFGIEDFLKDKYSKWLFAVHPTDEKSKYTQKQEHDLLSKLRENEKHIIFFESGFNFLKLQGDTEKSHVIIIKTDYKEATRRLINYAIKSKIKLTNKIHFITVLGPQESHAANQKRAIYNEFLSMILFKRDMDFHPELIPELIGHDSISNSEWNTLLGKLNNLEIIQISSLRVDNWYRDNTKNIIQKNYQTLSIDDPTVHHCFLCGNDDIALGIKEAIFEKNDSTSDLLNCSFFGFDGINEMAVKLAKGLNGATMKVDIDTMCQIAIRVVNGKITSNPPCVRAELLYDNHRSTIKDK